MKAIKVTKHLRNYITNKLYLFICDIFTRKKIKD